MKLTINHLDKTTTTLVVNNLALHGDSTLCIAITDTEDMLLNLNSVESVVVDKSIDIQVVTQLPNVH